MGKGENEWKCKFGSFRGVWHEELPFHFNSFPNALWRRTVLEGIQGKYFKINNFEKRTKCHAGQV